MRGIYLLLLCTLTLSTVSATYPGRAAEPTAEEIEEARGAAILSNSLALVEAAARELGRSANELEALAANARRPALPQSETEILLRRGPGALVSLAPMPRDFTAPAAGQAFASVAARHRAVAQMLTQAAAEASTLPIDAALEKIRKLDIPADHEFIVFPPDGGATTNVKTGLDAIDRSTPLTLPAVEPFIVGGLGWGGRTTDYPAIGSLLETENNAAKVICTGTLVGRAAFLTAAHCVCEKTSISAASCKITSDKAARIAKAKTLHVYLPHSGFYSIDSKEDAIFVNNAFEISQSKGTRGDLVLLHLSEPVLDVIPLPITDASMSIGTLATIVGFGKTNKIDDNGHVVPSIISENSAGIKLFAGVVISSCPNTFFNGLVCWEYVFEPSTTLGSTCSGDSGGPVIFTSRGQDVLAAVISGGTGCLPKSVQVNTDLANREYHDWITTTLATWSTAIVSTVQPLLEPTINEDRYLHMLPDDRPFYRFDRSPAIITLDTQVDGGSKFVTIGLNGTRSNATLDLTVRNIANGAKLCSVTGNEPAKVCKFASNSVERIGIEIVGRRFQEVQIVATSFSAE